MKAKTEVKSTDIVLKYKPDFTNQDVRFVLDPFELFYSWKGILPNIFIGGGVNIKATIKWFDAKFSERKFHKHFYEDFGGTKTKSKVRYLVYFLEPGILITFKKYENTIAFFFNKECEEEARFIFKNCPRKRGPESKGKLSVNLISSDHGLGTTRVHVPKRKINLADNYSADLKASHQIIRNALSDKNISGLVLLHGKPGTGKSTYLNFLLSQLDKEVFLLSPRRA